MMPRGIGWQELVLVVAFAALALLAVSSVRLLLVRHELAERADALKSEIAALEDDGVRLQRELDWSRSDAGIERLAREQLGWARSGETAVVIPDAPTPRPSPTPAPTRAAPTWRSLWGLLGG
jgi:cell division protein FtsB